MEENMNVIDVHGLCVGYGRTVVLRDLEFSVRRGEVFGILGGSGCGKSTLLKHLIGLYPVTHGSAKIFGTELAGINEKDKRALQRRFGVTYQNGALFGSMTVGENVALPLEEFTDYSPKEILVAAADVLQDKTLLAEALSYFKRTLQAIWELEFVTDQQAFDPKNPVTAVPGKILQGPFMIALGGIAFASELTGDEEFLDYGKKFIGRLLTLHTVYKEDKVQFFEAVTPENTPYIDNNGQLCDPGHALEFVGLSMKFLLVLEKFNRSCDQEFLDKCRKVYPAFFASHYAIGRQLPAGGIIKSCDLLSGRVINSDMPWWSLPETIRAAALLEKFCNMDNTQIIQECADSFRDYFVNPGQHYFAYQTCDKSGNPVRVIPAVPDLDPGYHTNLSLIDVLKIS